MNALDVAPSLSPAVSAIWKHPLWGGGGIYPGTGGLALFQAQLDGTITVSLDASVAAATTCHVTLPKLDRYVPAGDLGYVHFSVTPKLTLRMSTVFDGSVSATLRCSTLYRWNSGREYRNSYARPHPPMAGSSLTATRISPSPAARRIGDGRRRRWARRHHHGITRPRHYNPANQPEAQVTADAKYSLQACLACL